MRTSRVSVATCCKALLLTGRTWSCQFGIVIQSTVACDSRLSEQAFELAANVLSDIAVVAIIAGWSASAAAVLQARPFKAGLFWWVW